MSGLSYPNDELNHINLSLNSKENQDQHLLHSIDEAEDFYDPFSDLSLYLSKKIKKEILKEGSSKKWSSKIEANLLAKILPEFREKFPKYRLGASALKKVWEKVSYYYEKIQCQGNADKLDLKLMIRENLKRCNNDHHYLPPYTVAQHIATKLSEYIATLEGKRPKIEHLTKLIWAVQKHLIKNFSPLQFKSPYDEYDKLDKLIVKAQLEITAMEGTLDPSDLQKKIFKELKGYGEIQSLAKNNQLTSTLSMILAEKLYSTSLVNCHFSLKERKAIEAFVRTHIEMGKLNSLLKNEKHRLEMIQRILALYSITEGIPKNITEEELRKAIHLVKELVRQKSGTFPPHIDQALSIFIHAELHLMNDEKKIDGAKEEAIVKAYAIATSLPVLSPSQMDQFELLIWKVIEEEGNLLADTPPQIQYLLERELGNSVIDNPKQSFRMVISHTLQLFKKTLAISFDEELLEEKIETWTAQNDMLIAAVHFDPRTPLLQLIEKNWKEQGLNQSTVDHEAFIANVEKEVLKNYPLLSSFDKELRVRLWILYKYLWYQVLPDGSTSTYHQFILWHKTEIERRHPEWSKEKISDTLKKLSEQTLPYLPYAIGE